MEGSEKNIRLQKAEVWLGFSQRKDADALSKFTRVDVTRVEWCAAFMTAIEKECGFGGTNLLPSRSYLNYGTRVVRPEQGDIVILWRNAWDSWEGHVGYFAGQTNREICLLGGNQDGMVKYKTYSKERILGFRRPPSEGEGIPPTRVCSVLDLFKFQRRYIMKSIVTALPTAKTPTLGEVLQMHLDSLTEDEKSIPLYSALMILDTGNGVGYNNLVKCNLFSVIGMLELAKLHLMDEASFGEDG